jgi:hypothetical protein
MTAATIDFEGGKRELSWRSDAPVASEVVECDPEGQI